MIRHEALVKDILELHGKTLPPYLRVTARLGDILDQCIGAGRAAQIEFDGGSTKTHAVRIPLSLRLNSFVSLDGVWPAHAPKSVSIKAPLVLLAGC